MAKIFLDTNYFIDAIHRNPEKQILDSLEGHIVCISPLSIHIYCYIYKINIPNSILSSQLKKFQIIDFTQQVIERSLTGPTNDFEDNVQLHSAVEADCNTFLTNDKELREMKFFGKVKIDSN